MAIFELASKKNKNGRRQFTASLYELQPPECVVDDVGTKFNKNGITFLEEYAKDCLDSIKDMNVTVEFIDDEKTEISGHGDTGYEDGLPVFDNASIVGHFTEGYIDDVEINGELKRCVVGRGYLDEMRHHAFIQGLETQLNNGNTIDGSIEIYRSEDNPTIVYKKGWLPQGRIPTIYEHSGWALVVNPADTASTLLEINNSNQKEEQDIMDEKDLKATIQAAISEANDKSAEFSSRIGELNAQLSEKDNTISELNATVEQVQKALTDLKAEYETYWSERDALEKELGKLKAERRVGELNEMLSRFSEEEQGHAKSEINSFKENPLEGDIEAIRSKICVSIVDYEKANEKTAEQNSNNSDSDIDIFSEINEVIDDKKEEISIY